MIVKLKTIFFRDIEISSIFHQKVDWLAFFPSEVFGVFYPPSKEKDAPEQAFPKASWADQVKVLSERHFLCGLVARLRRPTNTQKEFSDRF
jgi:hypothetical protein